MTAQAPAISRKIMDMSDADLAKRKAQLTEQIDTAALPDEALEWVRKADEAIKAHEDSLADLREERARLDTVLSLRQADSQSAETAELIKRTDTAIAAHDARIAELRAQRDEIDAAYDVRRRREAAQQADAWRKERHAIADELEAEFAAYLDDAEAAQAALKELAKRVSSLRQRQANMRRLSGRIHVDGGKHYGLNPADLNSRLGGGISAEMRLVKDHVGMIGNLGGINWIGGSLYPPEKSWREREEKMLAPDIQQLVKLARE